MHLYYSARSGGAVDLTGVLVRAVWSGDTGQAQRGLDITLLWSDDDAGFPRGVVGNIQCGDFFALYGDRGEQLFTGPITHVERTLGQTTREYHADDNCFYVSRCEIAENFHHVTAPEVVQRACAGVGLRSGSCADGAGVDLNFVHIDRTVQDAIVGAYTQVKNATNKPYYVYADGGGSICVGVLGEKMAGRTLSSSRDITQAKYDSDINDAITRAVIVDKGGKVLGQADGEIDKYGILQAVSLPEDGAEPDAQARALLKGAEDTAELGEILGGPDAYDLISGHAVAVEEPVTGLFGVFYIQSDSHTWENGTHRIRLGLSFENLTMTEVEVANAKSGGDKSSGAAWIPALAESGRQGADGEGSPH